MSWKKWFLGVSAAAVVLIAAAGVYEHLKPAEIPASLFPKQIASFGYTSVAAVATKNGNWTGPDGKTLVPFAKGQQFCLGWATQGPRGMIESEAIDDYPNDGTFAPVVSTNSYCPNSASLVTKPWTPAADQNASSGGNDANMEVTISLVVFALLIAWHILGTIYIQTPSLREKLWQKNKDKYSFNDKTGDWQRIVTDRGNGEYIVDARSRSDRMVAEWDYHKRTLQLALPYYSFALASILLAIWLPPFPPLSAFLLLVLVLMIWPIARQYRYNNGLGGHLVIDPPRQERATEDFGPTSPISPRNHPAGDDLAYKPLA